MKTIERRVGKLEAASGLGSLAARQIDLFVQKEIQLSDEEFDSLFQQLSDDELDRRISQFKSI